MYPPDSRSLREIEYSPIVPAKIVDYTKARAKKFHLLKKVGKRIAKFRKVLFFIS